MPDNDYEEQFLREALARSKLAKELETRLGQLIANSLSEHLKTTEKLPAVDDNYFQIEISRPPEIGKAGEWSFLIDFVIPGNAGNITFLVSQFGGYIDVRNFNLTLPPKNFDVPIDPKYPQPEHSDAFYEMIDFMQALLTEKGFRKDKEFSIYSDYFMSNTIRVFVNDARIFRRSIAVACQKAIKKSKFPFVISMEASFGGKRVLEGEHLLIIRRDRIAPDWNARLLKTLSRGKFSWR